MEKQWDMYKVKESPREQIVRINGPRYNPKDERDKHLKVKIANLASDTNEKAESMIQAVRSVGFMFKMYPHGFEVVTAE